MNFNHVNIFHVASRTMISRWISGTFVNFIFDDLLTKVVVMISGQIKSAPGPRAAGLQVSKGELKVKSFKK